ncbi:hypothetical protein VB152_11680, partial [Xanthomonas fragariae]|nr:hypothetical protein [Xanthomonas fragariae]
VRMGGNCKKPAFSVANTGSFGTPVQTSRPCGRWVVGVFQGRLRKVAGGGGGGGAAPSSTQVRCGRVMIAPGWERCCVCRH